MSLHQHLNDEDICDDFEVAVPRRVRSSLVSLATCSSLRAVKRSFAEVSPWRSHIMVPTNRLGAERKFQQAGYRVSRGLGDEGRYRGMHELLRDKPLLVVLADGSRQVSLAGDRASLELATQQAMDGRLYVYQRPAGSGSWGPSHPLDSVPCDKRIVEFDECSRSQAPFGNDVATG